MYNLSKHHWGGYNQDYGLGRRVYTKQYWQGDVGEMKVFSKAMSIQEINEIFTSHQTLLVIKKYMLID